VRSLKYYIQSDLDNADTIFCFGDKNKRLVEKLTEKDCVEIKRTVGQKVDENHSPGNVGSDSLCFSGGGEWVSKGLDIVAEAFSSGDIGRVYICAAKKYERVPALTKKSTFHYGLLHPDSNKFRGLINRCRFVILMSCGEACPGSIVVCMRAGLIPIISEHVGDNFGGLAVVLTEVEILSGGLRARLCHLRGMSEVDLKKWSRKCTEYAATEFTDERMEESIVKALAK